MRRIAVVAALLFMAPTAASQDDRAVCRFSDVVQAPDIPAVLDRATRQRPRLEHLLLPAEPWTVRAWVRISPRGEVTGVCVPDAPDGVRAAFADAARQLRFAPARQRGRAVASVSAVPYEFGGRYEGQPHLMRVGTSTDVPWLEEIAGSAAAALTLWRSQARPIGQPKDLRVTAFARLGEIGSGDSLAAQRRLAATLASRPLVPYDASLDARWPHPGWHMSDYTPRPIAQIRIRTGVRIAIINADLLGPPQLFVLRCEDDGVSRCSRPKPAAPWRWRYAKTRAALTEIAPGRLRLEVVPVPPERPSAAADSSRREPSEPAGPETREIDLAEIDRDSDADGWTDLEEQILGLDSARRDSDGDGIDDGRDRAPLVGHADQAADADEAAILQAAIFATFGVTESRWTLFARNERVPRIEVPGLSAPVVFHRPQPADAFTEVPGGVFVTWRIVRRSAADAVVEITDWEAPLAAGGQEVFLRRIDGAWVVVARQTTWIS